MEPLIREAVQGVIRDSLESGVVDDKLTIRVDIMAPLVGGDVHRQPALLRAHEPVLKVIKAWCKHQNFALEDVCFSLGDLALQGTETLASLGFKTAHFLFTDKVVELQVEPVDKEMVFGQGAGDQLVGIDRPQCPVPELRADGCAHLQCPAPELQMGGCVDHPVFEASSGSEAMCSANVLEPSTGARASRNNGPCALQAGMQHQPDRVEKRQRFRSKTPDLMRHSRKRVRVVEDALAEVEGGAPSASACQRTAQKPRRRWRANFLTLDSHAAGSLSH